MFTTIKEKLQHRKAEKIKNSPYFHTQIKTMKVEFGKYERGSTRRAWSILFNTGLKMQRHLVDVRIELDKNCNFHLLGTDTKTNQLYAQFIGASEIQWHNLSINPILDVSDDGFLLAKSTDFILDIQLKNEDSYILYCKA